MYPLGKHFEVNMDRAICEKKTVFTGDNYRISVISERVVRLEFSPSGTFVDAPTQFIKRRNLGIPDFSIRQDPNIVEISTKYFILTYIKGQPFKGSATDPMKNLKILLSSSEKERQKEWYVGHPEARNLLGNMISVDMGIPKPFDKGLYSLDGFVSFDDSKSFLFSNDGTLINPPQDHTDIYVFMYDMDFRQALVDYFKMTGTPPLIPRYALGNWWSKNEVYDDNSIQQLMKNFEKNNIPISVMLFDHDWHIRNINNYKDLKTGFTFNKELFNEPEKMIKSFHDKGVHVGLCVNPTNGIYPHEEYFQQISQALALTEPKVVTFDPLNPKFLDILFKLLLHPLETKGIDFFWNDSTGDNNISKLWILNHYMFMDSGRDKMKRPMMLARGSVYAPHRYPVLYGGSSEISWDALAKLPLYYSSAANFGVSWWSHDVAGNHGGIEDNELYARYIQLSTFSPILRFHGARGKYYKKEPWLWDVKTQYIASKYLNLRHRLIPYLYTEAYNYTKAGSPLIQPFYYGNPWVYDDPLYKSEYYFGSELFVCPIVKPKDPIMDRCVHNLFLPQGVWYDFTTGKKYESFKKIVALYKDDEFPVFAPAGAIIPMSNDDSNNVELPTKLEIQIFPGMSNVYTLYEDDGISSLYKEGRFLKTTIDYNHLTDNYTVILKSAEGVNGIAPERRDYKIVFRNTNVPTEVLAYFNETKLEPISYADGKDFVIEVKQIPSIGQVSFNIKGTDISLENKHSVDADVDSVLLDLKIGTYIKEEVAQILFSKEDYKKKVKKIEDLKKHDLSKEYVELFIKLLDYINGV